MKNFEIKTNVTVYENENELSVEDQKLLKLARDAASRAYADYSRFQVGAALLLDNGEIVTGNNQENCAYPSGLCAERTTAFYASSRYPNVPFKKLVVTAVNPTNKLTAPVPPCGACRQVLSEYEQRGGHPITVLMAGEEGEIWQTASVSDLLPFSFSGDYLPEEEA